MALFHVKNLKDWDEHMPVQFMGTSYMHTVKGFRVLVQTGQLSEEIPGYLKQVWDSQLYTCGQQFCVDRECKIRLQIEEQVKQSLVDKTKPRLVVPDNHFSDN